ncbi:MAG: alpha/beta hydrolase-fold protein [Opitutaceae bacterium]
MNMEFPSCEFDEAVAAVCEGLVSEEQARALNALLRRDAAARDEYLLRVELHSRLASQPDLFVPGVIQEAATLPGRHFAVPATEFRRAASRLGLRQKIVWALGLAACFALLAAGGWRWQRLKPAPIVDAPAVAVPLSDWKPSATNLPGQEYPRIDSQRRAQFRIHAPDAKQVSVNIGWPLTVAKGDDGVWTITTASLGIGFHFYRVLIDGASVADPATQIFRGGGGDWLSSGIEIPTDEDFHEQKDVPHGEVREERYYSRTTDEWRGLFVYTPPNYQRDDAARFPVLYLLPGAGEDETCWGAQGRVRQILDNLIAERKARPMLVVMGAGVARKPGESERSGRLPADPSLRYLTLDEVFVNELIPMIDRTYRTIPDGNHRALAGSSLGAAQTFTLGLRHPDLFAYLGGFSGAASLSGRNAGAESALAGLFPSEPLPRGRHLIFLSTGAEEPASFLNPVKQYRDALLGAGIEHVFYLSPDTEHEWHTWRRSLREFVPLLFQP